MRPRNSTVVSEADLPHVIDAAHGPLALRHLHSPHLPPPLTSTRELGFPDNMYSADSCHAFDFSLVCNTHFNS